MSMEEYLRHFAKASDHKKIGEATPNYLRSRCAAQAIKAFSPGAQIIIMASEKQADGSVLAKTLYVGRGLTPAM